MNKSVRSTFRLYPQSDCFFSPPCCLVVRTTITAPCFISCPQGEIRISGGETQAWVWLKPLGRVQCAAGLLSTQEADDLLVGISTTLPKENGVSVYVTCPRPHSLEEPESVITPGFWEPKRLISFSLQSTTIRRQLKMLRSVGTALRKL